MGNPILVNVVNIALYTPSEAAELVSRGGVKKGYMHPDKVFLSAVSAGCLLSFGAAASLSAYTVPWFQENSPGLMRMVGAMVFPLGLVLVGLTGADLFVMAIIFGYGGVFDASPYGDEVIIFATKKQISPQFHQIFLRAIGCNWLVCLACYLAMEVKDLVSKVVAMWWPIFAFVSLGLDHVVANMFFIPLGIWLGTPGLTVWLYIWKGIVPTTMGNIVGGALFCAGYYWWMYLYAEPPTKVDGVGYDDLEHPHLWYTGFGRNKSLDEESRGEAAGRMLSRSGEEIRDLSTATVVSARFN